LQSGFSAAVFEIAELSVSNYSMMITVPLSPISADGSDRKFERVLYNGKSAVRIVPPENAAGVREAYSFFRIGTHLFHAGLPVPEIYEFDRDSGMVTVEDLGSTLLYDAASLLKRENRIPELMRLYVDAVNILSDFQKYGTPGFDGSWCFDTPVYDGNFAWEREAVYFMDSFLLKHCGIRAEEPLTQELRSLCASIDKTACAPCLMHRDFQSRNLMLHQGALGIIDFQGARSGPWGYDLASLVYDPYMDLPEDLRLELVELYIDGYFAQGENSRVEILRQFHAAALLRTLQVLGAFSFLSRERNRPFFIPFILPALRNLHVLVHRQYFADLVCLRSLSDSLLNR